MVQVPEVAFPKSWGAGRGAPSVVRAERPSAEVAVPGALRLAQGVEWIRPCVDLIRTTGFLVADARGRVVGRVEGPMYGASPVTPEALSVRLSLRRWRRCLVPAGAIEAIDDQTRVVGLRIERSSIRESL